MAALSGLSDLINRQSGGNNGNPDNLFFYKVPRIGGVSASAPVAGRNHSLWQYDGLPSGGNIPTIAEIPVRSMIGSMPFLAPSDSQEKFLIQAGITSTVTGIYLLYDRLFHIGGLSAAITTDQPIQGSTALTRNTNGLGNVAFYEIYSQVGTTSANLTMTYTNQAGVPGRVSSINIGGTGFREANRAQRIPLALGDTGIRAIEKIALSASTGTAGNFGITLAMPISWQPIVSAGVMGWRDYTTGLPGIRAIHPNACLSYMFQAGAATAPEIFGCLAFVEK
jgi:hypothetical protein